jgi:Ca2+-binding RTX toxin-like protein
VSLTDIETIRVINANTGNFAQSLDMSLTSGYKNLVLTGTSGFQFANVGSLVTAEMNATNPAAAVVGTNRAFEIAYDASVVSGTSDSQTLTLSGASTTANQTFFVNGIENLAVNFTTTRSGSAIDAANETQVTVQSGNGSRAAGTATMKNVTIAGNKEGVITFADTTITKIDASAMTATLRLTASAPANAGAISILGGSGNDIVVADTAGALDTADTVDGGAGSDTILLVNTGSIGAQNGIKNFEGVFLYSENSFDVTNLVANNKIGSVYYGLNAAGAGTIASTNIPEGTKAFVLTDVVAVDHGVKDATNAGTTNALTVTLDHVVADTDVDMTGTLTAAGIETLTIHSSGVSATTTPGSVITANNADTNSIATLTAAQASSISITGDADLVLTAISANAVLTSIDASKYTGRLLMTNTATSSTATSITGGSGADNITGRATADNISGGAGNDSLVGSGGNDTISGGAGADTLTGGAGNDVITGGDGNDSITAAAGSDNLDGGAGDDSFVITYANLTLDDTISGGAGSDAIRFADAADTAIDLVTDSSKMTNVIGVERIDLAAAAAQTVTLNDIAVTNAGGALTIRLANAGADADAVNAAGVLSSSNKVTVDVNPTITRTGPLTYTVGNGADVVSLGTEAVVDTFTVSNLIFLSSADTIAAGGGADVMNINDTVNAFSVNTSATTGRLKNVSGVETVNLTTGAIAASLTLDDTFVANNADTNGRFNFLVTGAADSGSAKTTLVVDASALTGSFGILSTYTANAGGTGGATLTGGAGNDSLTGGTTDDSIVGGAGNDTLSGAAGSDTISGGAGVDSITGGGGLDLITGGAGNDIVVVTANSGLDVLTDYASGDRIQLQGTAASAVGLAAGSAPTNGTYTIGTDFTFRLQASGNDLLTSVVADKVQLGVQGGTGFTVATGTTNSGGDFADYIIVADTTNGTRSSVSGGAGNDSIDGSASTDTTAQHLLGEAGDDTITGGAVADSLNGGAGNDSITAGAEVDTVVGGAGDDAIILTDAGATADLIVHDATAATGTAGSVSRVNAAYGSDTLTGFVGGSDILQFSETNYGALGTAAGAGDLGATFIGVLATTAIAFNASATDDLAGTGNFQNTTKGFIIVGTNAAGQTVDLYYYNGAGTSAATTVAAEVASGNAVKVYTIGVITAALAAANFADIV